MEHIRGQIPAESAEPSEGGEDRLSALPDEILVRLDTTAEAARTSTLARRWRGLSKVRFDLASDGDRIRDVLDVSEARDLSLGGVSVTTEGAAPGFAAAWLPVAARRLVGDLVYHNLHPTSDEEAEEEEEAEEGRGHVQLPCFEKATKIELGLGFLGLALPSQGVFGKLTELSLRYVRFHIPCDLGSAVSSTRCPCLQKLMVSKSPGLHNLSIHSQSLLRMELRRLGSLKQLTIVSPNLQVLDLRCSFVRVVRLHRSPTFQRLSWSPWRGQMRMIHGRSILSI